MRLKSIAAWRVAAPVMPLVFAGVCVFLLTGCAGTLPGNRLTPQQKGQQAWDNQRATLKYELASAELRQGKLERALTLAQEAVGLSPRNAGHGELLARVYLAQGDFAAARNVLLTVLASAPDAPGANYLLGTIYEREGRWGEAADAYRKAAFRAPGELDYRVALAQAIVRQGDAPGALTALRAAEDAFRIVPGYHLACAELHRQMANWQAASESYQMALRLGYDDAEVRASLALCLFWAGKAEAALTYLQPIMMEDSTPSSSLMRAYAGALLSTGKVQKAREWLSRFRRQAPDDAGICLLMAQAQRQLGDTAGALESAADAARWRPDDPDVHAVLAAIALDAEMPEQAYASARHALTLSPEHVDALVILGRVHELQGECEAARQAYRRVLELDPTHALADELLRRLPAEATG